jgi:hypothetical protein
MSSTLSPPSTPPDRDDEAPPSLSRGGMTEPQRAGLAFLEAVATGRCGREELRVWIEHNLVRTGYIPARPWRIQEPLFGALPEDKNCSAFLPEIPPSDETVAIVVRARARVVSQLRGFIAQPCDDRFLSAAIFAGRVRRVVAGQSMMWVPRPRSHDALSDIVLSLFVADILRRREHYTAMLCVCDECGRVRLDDDPRLRHACPQHQPDATSKSGIRRNPFGVGGAGSVGS